MGFKLTVIAMDKERRSAKRSKDKSEGNPADDGPGGEGRSQQEGENQGKESRTACEVD